MSVPSAPKSRDRPGQTVSTNPRARARIRRGVPYAGPVHDAGIPVWRATQPNAEKSPSADPGCHHAFRHLALVHTLTIGFVRRQADQPTTVTCAARPYRTGLHASQPCPPSSDCRNHRAGADRNNLTRAHVNLRLLRSPAASGGQTFRRDRGSSSGFGNETGGFDSGNGAHLVGAGTVAGHADRPEEHA
jgi:hypothetical protein